MCYYLGCWLGWFDGGFAGWLVAPFILSDVEVYVCNVCPGRVGTIAVDS